MISRKICTAAAFLSFLLLFAACGGTENQASAQFNAVVDEYIEWRLEANPLWATGVGRHEFDSLMPDMSAEAIQARHLKEQEFASRFEAIDPADLTEQEAIDHSILLSHFEEEDFRFNELPAWKRNPRAYGVSGAVYSLIKRDFAPLEDRLRSAMARMDGIPAYLGHARANLENPARLHTEVAIAQNRGAVSFFRNVLAPMAEGLEIADEFAAKCEEVAVALEDHGRWLEEDLLPRSNADWKVGPELYDRIFAMTAETDEPPEDFLDYSEEYFDLLRADMIKIASDNWSAFYPGEDPPADQGELIHRVMQAISLDHGESDKLVDDVNGYIVEIKQFIRDNEIIDLPEPDRLEVVRMPEFQAGSAVAYNDQPPAFDPDGKSFYAVTPTPKSWSAERVESFMREYNQLMLRLLTIHEAYPGHYVQGWYASKLDSPVRKLFGSGIYAEGWATYCEWMMLDEGFYADNPGFHLQRLKYNLRCVANAIIDQKMHKGMMTDEECLDLLVNGAFQTEEEARGKLQRVKLGAGQLSTYFYGFRAMTRLRADYEELKGEDFVLKDFHYEVVRHGSPPMRLLRKLLLGEQG